MEMLKLINIIRITTIVMTWLSGIILNSSIVAVYIGDQAYGQHFSVSDKIFLSTALLNIVQQCFISAYNILYYYALYLLSAKEMFIFLYISNCSLIYGSFWYSAWLSIYYFLTLVKCSHHFFLQLKKTLSSSIVQILITTLLVIVFLNAPCIWAMGIVLPQNETINQSGSNYQITINLPFTLFNLVCGCCIPFLATLFCIGHSVASLLGHVRRVHQNVSQFTSSPQIQGLLRAARTMTLQLTLNTVLCVTVSSTFLISPTVTLSGLIQSTIIMSFSSAQAMTLVLGNPKLRDGLFCRAVPSRV
ncbi:taste receptor type 2 member 9-like [Hyperolius riggenbachi]|uniref:taste receptor type 2 member 9-like n=1 Tax=Hyperolius riggenbachi TaxID=752182 RepID=UPI0035A2EBA7